MKKTTTVTKEEKKWYLIDATGIRLGILATTIARLLIGKDKAKYSQNIDSGDNVIVINTKKVGIHPKKIDGKIYWRHSGYPGGIKQKTFGEMIKSDSNKVIEYAVKGMLPRTRLANEMLKKLYTYVDERHQHEAQKPKLIELNKDGGEN
ncbi:MAG: 50S ribosomal protein L13 [Candidatus Dojkabacteria bacterium]|jgi:large subunit ribosomal protein L13|nr:50S ribosomal protein L13 [Candidatus Dojkabacteria bacterium]